MIKFFKLLALILCLASNSLEVLAEKKALIIAVGDYQPRTGWGKISSANDIPLIKDALISQGFDDEKIAVIRDQAATRKGILDALAKLYQESVKGDIVVVHYSGHGQQIFDDNGDEADGLDEALVPYDAFSKFAYNYQGENHIRDDELGNIINQFRNKLGTDGQLLFILDSCHSGSATRGGIARGGQGALTPPDWKEPDSSNAALTSSMFERTKLDDNSSPFVMISGASADELNYEYQGKGSLSYAFSVAMTSLGSEFSYRQLFSNIAAQMSVISPLQSPAIDGDLDFMLFNGDYLTQSPFFNVKRIAKSNLIQIDAGKLQGVFENTTIFLMPAGTSDLESAKPIAKGKVINTKFNEAVIELESDLSDLNEKLYWVFIDQPSYGDLSVSIFIEESEPLTNTKKEIEDFFKMSGLGEVVSDTAEADLQIRHFEKETALFVSNGLLKIQILNDQPNAAQIDELKSSIASYAQGKYLKQTQLKNPKFEIEFRLRPISFDEILQTAELLPDDTIYQTGILKVRPDEDRVVLEVTNKSKTDLYFSIIEINSKGEIGAFMPNNNCTMNDQERKISAGQTVIYSDCIFSFGPPYEKLMLKSFAAPFPINFQPTVQQQGMNSRGNSNPLEKFVQLSFERSRGSSGSQVAEKMDGYSYEYIYEIVEN
ncbi:hypothetical protein Belba_0596 [Belliella baltica DSM 15883]|uniref:Peptidase C14 caspase domain-containing protein n=1 Tax=Belliella baltica (strain DSM 15883 / CIP 108006 / LMG 21964 / BA134) TaxID=866536 RepID=I3Z1Y5_BELBD|nr:caspase family protein [Belliella baltica]AFL83253.1 hypothetical protein Belba_0596 [Belliella baltica DSM 15883]